MRSAASSEWTQLPLRQKPPKSDSPGQCQLIGQRLYLAVQGVVADDIHLEPQTGLQQRSQGTKQR